MNFVNCTDFKSKNLHFSKIKIYFKTTHLRFKNSAHIIYGKFANYLEQRMYGTLE